MKQTSILVVEDERIVARDIRNTLKRLGYVIADCVSTGELAIEKTKQLQPDLVLMDIVLKGKMNGVQAAGIIQENFDIPIIYLTAYADENTIESAKQTQPLSYILKPFQERELHTAIEIGIHRHHEQVSQKQHFANRHQELEKQLKCYSARTEELEEHLEFLGAIVDSYKLAARYKDELLQKLEQEQKAKSQELYTKRIKELEYTRRTGELEKDVYELEKDVKFLRASLEGYKLEVSHKDEHLQQLKQELRATEQELLIVNYELQGFYNQ